MLKEPLCYIFVAEGFSLYMKVYAIMIIEKYKVVVFMFADIYINLPVKSISQSFTYFVPEELDWIEKGHRVIVPFGSKLIEGFVVDIYEDVPKDINLDKIKKIHSAVSHEPWFTARTYETAKWMRDYYLCSLGECMRLFIPGKGSVKIDERYFLAEAPIGDETLLTAREQQVLACFNREDSHSFSSLQRMLPELKNLHLVLGNLVKEGFLIIRSEVKNRARAIYESLYGWNQENFPEESEADSETEILKQIAARFKSTPAQRKAAEYFYANRGEVFTSKQLKEAKITVATVKKLLEQNYLKEKKQTVYRNSYELQKPVSAPERVLTEEQLKAVKSIREGAATDVFLLYGITGSGKTQVYIELAKGIAPQQQIAILVPEIVLTGQLVQFLQEYFYNEVVVIHSRLTVNERNDAFNRIRRGEVKVIIGARSAIFAPFRDLAIIIMDEEHDNSYKQDEAPRYHTRDLALAMGRIYGAKVVLASATPSLESYHAAVEGKYKLLTMLNRIDNVPLPEIKAVDMRRELHYGNRKILSRELQDLIKATLEQKQQIIIMLNRRGYSTFVMCRNCGYVVKCEECTMPMVYHRRHILQCHHCDITAPVPEVCPSCGSKYIKFFGSGTQKLESELETLFPEAKILRLDRDTTGKKLAHQEILNKFKSGEYQILLGTQMVAKGHDIPNVTAVGIIAADSSINIPEFRAGERCFSLITQTAGRAGRGKLPGKVIVQAYSMDHYALQWGVKQDYVNFYKEELALRELLFFPPFSNLIKLTCSSLSEEESIAIAKKIKKNFDKFKSKQKVRCEIMGPAPALLSPLRKYYRYNLLLKSTSLEVLQEFIRTYNLHLEQKVIIDVNPINTN